MTVGQKIIFQRLRRAIKLLLAAGIVFGIAWAFHNVHLIPGFDTTRITAPMDHGYPDYLGTINDRLQKDVSPDNNAAPLLLEACGVVDATPRWKSAVFAKLGMREPEGGALERYPAWALEHGREAETRAAPRPGASPEETSADEGVYEEELKQIASAPWNAAHHPSAARWLRENEPLLAKIEDACRRPRFFIPRATDEGLMRGGGINAVIGTQTAKIGWLGSMRIAAQAFNARAMFRLDAGDVAGFDQDVITIMALARLMQQQSMAGLVTYLVAISTDSSAMDLVQHAGATNRLSAAQAQALRRRIESLSAMATCADAINVGERYTALDMICSMRKASSMYGMMNFNKTLRFVNRIEDDYVAAMRLGSFAQRSAAVKHVEDEVDRVGKTGFALTSMGEIMASVFLSHTGRVQQLQTSCWQERDLALTVLALREARANGVFPAALEELRVTDFSVPRDRFTDQPLIYRRQRDGFILYSVAENQKDDGGLSREKARSTAPRTSASDFDMVIEAEY